MTLDDYITEVFCLTDDFLADYLDETGPLRERGPKPTVPDSVVLTCELVGEFLSYDTDSGIPVAVLCCNESKSSRNGFTLGSLNFPKTSQCLSPAMAKTTEKWVGRRLTPAQKARIERLAERKGTTQKDAVLSAVSRELSEAADDDVEPQPGSFMEGIEDLAGSVNGPEDLSTNPKYLDDLGQSSL